MKGSSVRRGMRDSGEEGPNPERGDRSRWRIEPTGERVQGTTAIPSPTAQSALAIIAELERLLDMGE
jgi:hypothetical protein